MRAPRDAIAAARKLRRALSAPEAMLWSRLRARAPAMPAFRRRHPIGPYVLDFYCANARLAVEIDGRSHEVENRPQRDARRDASLRAQGVTVRRIPAAEVLSGVDNAADGIMRHAMAMIAASGPLHRPHSPSKDGRLSTSYEAGPPPPQAGEDGASRA